MPAKKCFKINQSAVGTTGFSVVPTALFISFWSWMQGFRASHSTACLYSVVLSGLFKLKVENLQRAVSCELWAVLPNARSSLLVACCVRDWSGILCEHFRTTDNGHFWARRNEASKDIAESPARSERPKERQQSTDYGQQTETPSHQVAEMMRWWRTGWVKDNKRQFFGFF